MRRRSALVVALALVVGACSSSDGRSLPAPPNGATTTPVSAPVVGQPTDDDSAFALTSDAFVDAAPIPARFTCDGADVSPALHWSGAPPAAELAVVVRDDDADDFVHWVLTGIDPLVEGIGEAGVPEGAVEARNDAGTTGWSGPCPPAGSTHTYTFAVYALPEPLALEPGHDPREAAGLVEGASSAAAFLTGTYTR